MAKIKGLRVLITGASSGIGRETAFGLAKRGAILAVTARRSGALRKVSNEIKDAFPEAQAPLSIPGDVSDKEAVSRLVKRCVDCLGGIDILINNAGIGVYGNTELTAVEDFRSVMEVNFFGSLHCILEVLPLMKKIRKGLIINVASVAAIHGVPYLGAYSASKAALVALSQSLISIMIVNPG
jgi:short-subunit dehydrogenase